jgi:hypothetical protein
MAINKSETNGHIFGDLESIPPADFILLALHLLRLLDLSSEYGNQEL